MGFTLLYKTYTPKKNLQDWVIPYLILYPSQYSYLNFTDKEHEMYKPTITNLLSMLCIISVMAWVTTLSAEDKVSLSKENLLKYQKSVKQGITFLKNAQNKDGSWSNPKTIGITAICVTALLKNDVPATDETVDKALTFLKSHIQQDGGIYHPDSSHKNYETSITIMAFIQANKKKEYTKDIEKAVTFLKGLQWDEGEGKEPDDTFFGGQGYGGHKRPDLSNTQFFLDALVEAGISKEDPAYKKALSFVSNTQNLESEFNTTKFADKVKDGGFYYTPAAGGTSQAGLTPNGGLRSYGSMTYAGLKSMIHCGVSRDDKRVVAATTWIKNFYTLKENPGLGKQGLYYYYHTFSKTMHTLGIEKFEDAKGIKHNWRQELVIELADAQAKNGSWTNPADRWYEGDPQLVTSYALLALSYINPQPEQNN